MKKIALLVVFTTITPFRLAADSRICSNQPSLSQYFCSVGSCHQYVNVINVRSTPPGGFWWVRSSVMCCGTAIPRLDGRDRSLHDSRIDDTQSARTVGGDFQNGPPAHTD